MRIVCVPGVAPVVLRFSVTCVGLLKVTLLIVNGTPGEAVTSASM